MENINAVLIEKEISKPDRLKELIRLSEKQVKTLNDASSIKSLKKEDESTYIDATKKSRNIK